MVGFLVTPEGFVAGQLKMDDNETSSLIVFLAATHDIGKVNPSFQGQIEWFRSPLESSGMIPPSLRTVSVPHGW
jgi:hypothetical protein